MTQPDHVPMQATDRVRPAALLPPPRRWYLERPGDPKELEQPSGPRFGSAGPDLGYGLKLARLMAPKLQLAEGDHLHDVIAGGFACGARRAASFGRAPVIYDMEWAYTLWGFLAAAPEALVEWRKPLFRGAGEAYWQQRKIVDAVKVDALKLTPAQVRDKLANWKDLLIV